MYLSRLNAVLKITPKMVTPRSINTINTNLISRIKHYVNWDEIKTTEGQTQNPERSYKDSIVKAILDEGGVISSFAGSQKPKDLQGVSWPGLDDKFDYELKKIDKHNGSFPLNDTIPENRADLFYIFLRTQNGSIDIRSADSLISSHEIVTSDQYLDSLKELSTHVDLMCSMGTSATVYNFQELFKITIKLLENAVKSKLISIFEYGQMFKFATNFGFLKSRPRPNWFMSTRVLDQESSPQPVELVVEEQHSPIEQPDPSMTLPLYSPLETPVSV